jgi:DNA-binding transcriptional ArsR family regulator
MTETDVFRAIADPTRRQIMTMLAQGDLRVSEIASQFEMTRPAVSKHLALLESANLIQVERQGRETINRLNPDGLEPVAHWLTIFDMFWDDKLTRLKRAVEGSDD